MIYRLKPIFQIVFSRNLTTHDLEDMLGQDAQKDGYIEKVLSSFQSQSKQEIQRLKESEQYRREFIGNLSHEIKTPILNIQGYILTLLDGGINDPNINIKYLERAEKSIDRMINLVRDMEVISKLESGVCTPRKEIFEIIALIKEVVEETEFEAKKRNINVIIGNSEVDSDKKIFVYADKNYIEQVLTNLIINSFKYGKQNGYTKIYFVDLLDKVMIEIEDNGEGIKAEHQPRIFERFYRTDKNRSRDQGGTGLGLSIVKHIIEAHNETITLRSQINKGSTFSFTLTKI